MALVRTAAVISFIFAVSVGWLLKSGCGGLSGRIQKSDWTVGVDFNELRERERAFVMGLIYCLL